MLDNTLSKVVYVADGIQKQWDIPFEFYKIEDVHIYITSDGEHIEEIDQNYYYDEEGKFFIYPTEESKLDPIPTGTQVLILRETENTQLEDSSEIYFKSKDIERGLDNLTMQVQDLKRDSLRAVKLSHFATQTPEDFTKGIFEAEKRATEAAAKASLSEQNAASSETSAVQASASATASAELAQSAANNGLQYAERAENAAAGSAASAVSAAESANLAQDLLNQFDGNVYSKPEIDAKVSGLQAEIDLVESYIPLGTNDVNTLVNKQQLFDEEMDIREDLNEGLSELQTQITAQAAAIVNKQEKLVAGENITIDGNVISATGGGGGGGGGSADIAKAIENQNTAIDTINPIYNWVGTQQEYEEQNIAEEHPDWVCFITDDIGEDVEEVYPATEEQAGIVFLASQNEALEGFDDSKAMTPLKTAQKVYESVGRVIQLGFDGTLSGNILTFEPDTDTPYEIKNGFSYEIDLLFPAVVADGALDENIEMVINNNGESIKIINALNDDTSTNITVGNMKQIMKYTTDIGFRWIFNARFSTTQDGTKVFVMPSTVINFKGESSSSGASKNIGEVYYSQSSLATDNAGALPLFTGETITSADTIYPDFYSWVENHPELTTNFTEYQYLLDKYGECPLYCLEQVSSEESRIVYSYNFTDLKQNCLDTLDYVYGYFDGNSFVKIGKDSEYGLFYTAEQMSDTGTINQYAVYLDSGLTKRLYGYAKTDLDDDYKYRPLFLSLNIGASYIRFSIFVGEEQNERAFGSGWSVAPSTLTSTQGSEIAKFYSYTKDGSLRLPKLANYIKMANADEGITQKGSGLPNITFANVMVGPDSGMQIDGNAPYGSNAGATVKLDASVSNPIYGNSDTVTPSHTTLYPWVYAFSAAIEASVAQAAEFQEGLSGKADANLGNIPTNYDYVVDSYSDEEGNWYRVYKSGWIEQGGTFTTTSLTNATSYKVNLLKPMSNSFYYVSVRPVGHSGYFGDDWTVVGERTTTTFNTSTPSGGCVWYVCGQGA